MRFSDRRIGHGDDMPRKYCGGFGIFKTGVISILRKKRGAKSYENEAIVMLFPPY